MDYDPMQVYTLADLDDWAFEGTALAVLGHPVTHSLSPQMHNAALADMATRQRFFDNWRYFKFDVDPDDLPVALQKFHEKQFEGLNLTVPHKVRALDLVEGFKPGAHAMGAVNTLIHSDTGYVGDNTDGYGLQTAVAETLGENLHGSHVMIVGAGGASRAICVHLLLGVDDCRLTVVNRSARRLEELVANIERAAPEHLSRVTPLALDAVDAPAAAGVDLLVNITSLGLKPGDPAPISLDAFKDGLKVYDTTYGRHDSALITAAKARGMPCANGLSMLVHQGIRSLEIWTGAEVPVDVMRAAVE